MADPIWGDEGLPSIPEPDVDGSAGSATGTLSTAGPLLYDDNDGAGTSVDPWDLINNLIKTGGTVAKTVLETTQVGRGNSQGTGGTSPPPSPAPPPATMPPPPAPPPSAPPAAVPPPVVPTPPAPPPSGVRPGVIVAGALGVTALGLGVYLLTRTPKPPAAERRAMLRGHAEDDDVIDVTPEPQTLRALLSAGGRP